jgi:hypothetical protein
VFQGFNDQLLFARSEYVKWVDLFAAMGEPPDRVLNTGVVFVRTPVTNDIDYFRPVFPAQYDCFHLSLLSATLAKHGKKV